MSNYEKPIILANGELSEGVFAASGSYPGVNPSSSGYNVNYWEDQTNDAGTGKDFNVFHVDMQYNGTGDSYNSTHTIAIEFDKPVEVIETSGYQYEMVGNTLYITAHTGANQTENVGLSAVKVKPTDGSNQVKINSATASGY